MQNNILRTIKYFFLYCRFGKTFVPDTIFSSRLFNSIMRLIHFKEHSIRKKIPVVQENKKIQNNIGFKVMDQNLTFNNDQLISLGYLKEKFNKINWVEDQEVNRKKEFLLMKSIQIDSNLKNIIDGLLPIVSNYIGSLPVLQEASFWYSPNKINEKGRSQSWHMDSEDVRQLKVMIPIEEITEDHGPLNVISADKSEKVYKKLIKKKIVNKRNVKLDDSVIEKHVGESYFSDSITIKKNQIAFVDTCRCYHYGSRKSEKSRKLLMLHFTSAYSLYMPIFRRKMYFSDYSKNISSLIYGFKNNNFYTFSKINIKKWDFKIL
tara:strand:- start:422 stop:1381 length:960 start_codon:yes stop_codon:yes gene_type:complete